MNTGYPVQALSEPVNTISTTYNIFPSSPNQQQDFEDVDFSTLTSPLGAKSEEKILECEINNIHIITDWHKQWIIIIIVKLYF